MKTTDTELINEQFRIWLQKQFSDKCRKNPRFSLRAFSQMLGIDPSTISQILSGKRNVSSKIIRKICKELSTPPEICESLLAPEANVGTAAAKRLSADAFAVIADWQHYAILELTYTTGFKSDAKWIGQKLGISQAEATIAISRLERLELLRRERGRLVKSDSFITNYEDGFTAPALKEFQRQILQKALHAIDFVPPEKKDITSITMSVNPEQLPEARRKIRDFRRELCAFLEKGRRSHVYNFALQLYPISASTVSSGELK
jgi:transcriptional regulator with XRE-family HTH domain